MTAECMTIRYLRELASRERDRDAGLAAAAGAVLQIISDVRENYMSERDVSILHMLVDEIRKSGHDVLLEHLRHEAPDCDLCAALAARAFA
ncbi:MAG: hypothetical protein RBS28_03800 [Rhodocyclaceae bacterium]|nr:hypothetical protein [Rhodocyclaceae bacterium]